MFSCLYILVSLCLSILMVLLCVSVPFNNQFPPWWVSSYLLSLLWNLCTGSGHCNTFQMNDKVELTIFESHSLDVVGTPWNDRSYLYLGRRRINADSCHVHCHHHDHHYHHHHHHHHHIATITAIKTCCFANSGKSARSDTPGPRAEPPKLIAHYNHDHNDYYDDTRTADIKRVKSIKVTTEPAR